MSTATQGTSTSTITVTWSAATGATGYNVYRNSTSTPDSATKVATVGAAVLSYADTPPANGRNFYYWASANNASGEGVKSTNYKSGYTQMTPPTVSASTTQVGVIVVSWSAVTNAFGYYVFMDGDGVNDVYSCDSSVHSFGMPVGNKETHTFAVSTQGEVLASQSALSAWVSGYAY